ncbi:hypothetical protein P280DRAFT_160990 [Massarina eburnea CBS 473.64]|uniref:Uncharacterized protein n=1 Tax=Massarina eburnea CBS 473.64 TaxID=1395130 RepID=A0A6A6RQ96_9PLEO|nr:hypothetical protein P280DRAFT_160990 [Massarina eburnea CBS 473.64]
MSRTEDDKPGARVHGPEQSLQTSPQTSPPPPLSGEECDQAAQLIQRNYRGYRARRQLQGFGLDASSPWAEVRTLAL